LLLGPLRQGGTHLSRQKADVAHPDAGDAANDLKDLRPPEAFVAPNVTAARASREENTPTYAQLERNGSAFVRRPAKLRRKGPRDSRHLRRISIMRIGTGSYAMDDYWVEARNVPSDVLRDRRVRVIGYYVAPMSYETQVGGVRTIPAVLADAVLLESTYRARVAAYERDLRSYERERLRLLVIACRLDREYGIDVMWCAEVR
jgi:hypothetical protein